MNACRTPASTARRAVAVLITLILTTTAAGCGSSSKKKPGSSAPTPSATSQAGGSASSADVAAIKNAYAKFFDSNTSVDESVALLQDGPAFRQTLVQQSRSSQAKGASATVSRVAMQSANTAQVVFTISVNGTALLKDTPGFAVREKGTWKVAGATFCGLLTLQGTAPPACHTPAGTALPS